MKLTIKYFQLLLMAVFLFTIDACNYFKNPSQLQETNQISYRDFPIKPTAVNDLDSIFTASENKELTKLILDFKQKTTNQIAVVTINHIGSYTDFDQYALDLSNYMGIGLKDKDNGLTLIFSKNHRKIRINTGNNTSKILTDDICEEILNQIILPEFKQENYYIGIKKGLEALIMAWESLD